MATDSLPRAREALIALLHLLNTRGYRFTTPTPATHARVVARPDRAEASTLRDVLGWSLPFRPGSIDGEIEALLDEAGALRDAGQGLRAATVRVSSLHDRLFVHSAYPTEAADAVFFGPDSYRFADLIRAELPDCPAREGACIVDIGTGSGVGAIVAATACPSARVFATDINPAALRLAGVNAAAAGLAVELVAGSGLAGVPGEIDVALANPPFMADDAERAYRHGGDLHGGRVAIDMAAAAAARLAPGGRLILYTGAAIVDGEDAVRRELARVAEEAGCRLRYRELDPDIFGEELNTPAYADVERIALVAAVLARPD
jgi:methylase of polypeptide subunit release factors